MACDLIFIRDRSGFPAEIDKIYFVTFLKNHTLSYNIENLKELYKYIVAAILFCAILSLGTTGVAQRPVIHYDQENGLPGDYCYALFQDSYGYLWIGTDNGLARFNGYEFKIITIKDGLPDNEILLLKESIDRKIWFIPFSPSIGYIKNGEVYSQENDSVVNKLNLKAFSKNILFDKLGNTFILRDDGIIIKLSPSGVAQRLSFNILQRRDVGVLQYLEDDLAPPRFLVSSFSENLVSVYALQNDSLFCEKVQTVSSDATDPTYQNNFIRVLATLGLEDGTKFSTRINRSFFKTDQINTIKRISPETIAVARNNGCFLIDIKSARTIDTLLFGYNVTKCIKTTDGSLWLSTIGNGIFRFLSTPIKAIKIASSPNLGAVYAMNAAGAKISAVTEHGYLTGTVKNDGSQNHFQIEKPNSPNYKSCVYLGNDDDGNWIECGYEISKKFKLDEAGVAIDTQNTKDVFEEDQNNLLIATGNTLARLSKKSLSIEKLYHGRTTCVAKLNGTIYLGTLSGLLMSTTTGKFNNVFQKVPLLSGHIIKMCVGPDQTLWVANSKTSLSLIKDNKIIGVLGDRNGFSCNKVTAMRVSKEFIWVATDNGVYAIYNSPPYKVAQHLTKSTGLNSNHVICISIADSRIWLGTSNGINYFDEKDLFKDQSQPQLIISNLKSGGEPIPIETHILTQRSLSFDFDIVDHVGGQRPLFEYSINGRKYMPVNNGSIFFPEVPFGDLSISLHASSPNWPKELYKELHFYRPFPVFKQAWFIILSCVSSIILMVVVLMTIIKRERNKDRKKLSIERNLLLLEQMALQGKMNPHFIFNCISAIKHFYSSGNTERANSFIDHFAVLIRQSFDMSTKTFVTLDVEMSYIERYLSIEKVRFNNSFSYAISKNIEINEHLIFVPAMLLQPIVENAVNHGIRHLLDKSGMIEINVSQSDGQIRFVIEDNGIGRKMSTGFNEGFSTPKAETSTSVNLRRIEILNRLFNGLIHHEVEDLTDADGQGIGTKVSITYPLSIQNTFLDHVAE